MPDMHFHCMKINSNEEKDGNNILDWENGVYPKKYIKSYFLSEHGEKISIDNMDAIGNKRGYLFSHNDAQG